MNVLLSIVIPMYNIQDYIIRCLESFSYIREEFKNDIEILVVNDGSTDLSKNIVEKYIVDKNYIRLINKNNGGHGSTINEGLKNVKGTYFKVVDGDDWVNPKELEKLIFYLKSSDFDMVVTDYTEHHEYSNFIKRINIFDEDDICKLGNMPNKRIPMHAITYKTKLLKDNNLVLSEGIFYVDIQYTIFPVKYIKSWVYKKFDVYQYFLGRPDQSMNFKNMLKNSNDHMEVLKSILYFLENNKNLDDNTTIAIKNTLDYMIKVQLVMDHYNKSLGLISVFDEYNYKYKKNKSIFSIIYFNIITKRKFSYVLDFIIDKKLSRIKKENFYES